MLIRLTVFLTVKVYSQVKVALGNKDIQNDFNYVRVHDLSSDAVRTAFGRIVFAEIILE